MIARSTSLKLSIVVLNYNSGELLKECLDSVFADEFPFPFEVIVPDNASTDLSLKLAVDSWGDRIRTIPTGANRGFSGGNNIGIQASRGEYICLLNPDTTVDRGCFRALIAFLDANPRVACAGPKVFDTDRIPQNSAKRTMPGPWDAVSRALLLSKLFPRSRRLAGYDDAYGNLDLTQEVDACASCCMALRRTALDAVGPFDEGYFIYCEDVDWFLRARSHGWTIGYVAEASIVHLHAYSARFRKRAAVEDFHRSMLRFYRKHYASSYPTPLNWVMYAGVHGRRELILLAKSLRGWR